MNLFLVTAVTAVIVISASGKWIETDTNTAMRCRAAVGSPPTGSPDAMVNAYGDAIVECVRIQNNFAKKK